ncbi:hypothetical protein ADL26_16880, partial [Thermoactinomyces vulgaris]
RAAAEEVAVLDLAGEGVDGPLVGLGGDDVEVAVEEEGAAARVGAGVATGDGGAAGRGLVDLRFEADFGQLLRDVLGGGALALGGRVVAGVGGVDPDEVAGDVDDLVLRAGRVRGFSHP